MSRRATTTTAAPLSAVPAPRSRRKRTVAPVPPLGSLTQRERRNEDSCASCGSHHVTQLAMTLTDGTPVQFISCHHCEDRRWEHEGTTLSVESVIARTRKTA